MLCIAVPVSFLQRKMQTRVFQSSSIILQKKYLEELYEDQNLEAYYDLNSKIEEGYASVHFRENYRDFQVRCIQDYYNWICVRYSRSLEKKDRRPSEELFRCLECEYTCLLEKVMEMLKSETDFIHKSAILVEVITFSRELIRLAEMVPDEIATAEETKRALLDKLEELAEKAEEPGTIKKSDRGNRVELEVVAKNRREKGSFWHIKN